jgi:hypothetical protein
MNFAWHNWMWWVIATVVVGTVLVARKKMNRGKDIAWPDFPAKLDWDAAASSASLEQIYQYAVDFSAGSVKWYQSRRWPKRIVGFSLRVGVVLATVLAGLVPLAKDLGIALTDGRPIPPQYSTLLLAFAGLCISIDHLGGYTSGWVRYMLAQQKIERACDAFKMEWNALKLGTANVQAMLDRAKTFLLTVGKIVDDETQEWATEFQDALKELERVRKLEADTPRLGALEITVKNPQLVAGWTLEIDGNQRGATTGRILAISDVPIGLRKVRVHGKDSQGTKTLSDEKIVKIEGGLTVTQEMTLG